MSTTPSARGRNGQASAAGGSGSPRARGRTLDLGSGTGRNRPLFPAGVTAVGLDPSPEALRRARRRAPGIPLVRGSAEALLFRDGSFDTVVSGLVFCSVADAARGLAEVRRVLRPDGDI